jgi:hypothetical protein
MTVSRRGLLSGLVGLVAAPAIVRASSLMPVKAYAAPLGTPSTNTWGEKLTNNFLLNDTTSLPSEFIGWSPVFDPSGKRITQGGLVLMERPDVHPVTGQLSKQIRWSDDKLCPTLIAPKGIILPGGDGV